MTISRASAFVVVAALGVLLTMVGDARQVDSGVQLRAAIEKEEVAGDLEGAMALYRQIIAANGKNRSVIAKAMLRLAGCYEKLGQTEARKLYERLVAEYSDQTQEAASARARLAALVKSTDSQRPTFRRILIPSKHSTNDSGKLSPDGRTLAYVEERSLWTVPVAGKSDPNIAGAPTRLTEPMYAWDSGNVCIQWSADGKWIGFLVELPKAGKDGTPLEELYVVPAAGGTPRRVHERSDLWAGAVYTLRYALSAGGDVLYFAAGKEAEDLRIYSMPTRDGAPRPITTPTSREPALSPDGSRIAFVKGTKSGPGNIELRTKEVWIASADGNGARLAYRLDDERPGAYVRGPIWSPDGKMLAFLVCATQNNFKQVFVLPLDDRGGAAVEPARFDLPRPTTAILAGWTKENRIGIVLPKEQLTAIHTVPAAGGKAVQLTPKSGYSPAWTPDSKAIYFAGTHSGELVTIEVVPAEGGPVKRLPLGEYERLLARGTSFSPDGQWLAVGGSGGSAIAPGLFVLPAPGGPPKRLASGWVGGTAWSPDGATIAFVRVNNVPKQGTLQADICVIPRDGGEPRPITADTDRPEYTSGLSWSPDGRTIAFRGSDKTLRLVPAGGGVSRVLVEGIGGGGPTWSPDGTMLAYVSKGAIWKIPAAGGTPVTIETGLTATPETLAWSPDGKSIAFSATSGGGEDEFWFMEDFVRLVKRAPAQKVKK